MNERYKVRSLEACTIRAPNVPDLGSGPQTDLHCESRVCK